MSEQQSPPQAPVTVFASPTSWVESDAVAQCHQVATLDGMVHVAAMPDLHPQECVWALARLLRRLDAEAAGRGLGTRRVEAVAGPRAGTYRSVLVGTRPQVPQKVR